MQEYCVSFVCLGMGCCGVIVTWIFSVTIFSWFVNIANSNRWIDPYKAYEKILRRDFSANNDFLYNM